MVKLLILITILFLTAPVAAQPFNVPPVPPYFHGLADRAKTDLNAVLELRRELVRASGRCRPMERDWFDFETSIHQQLKKMLDQGQIKDPELMYQLVGFRPLRDNEKNEDWLKMAAEAGHPLAMLDYAGRVYSKYNPRLRAEGEALYQKAAPKVLEAALAGDRRILLALARGGLGDFGELKFSPPYNNGWYWYQKLIEKKDHLAYKAMAEVARYDVDSEDYVKSLAMAQEAAEAGEWEAMVYLAERYKYGKGVPVDLAKAQFWMNKVVEVTGCDQAIDYLDDEGDITQSEEEGLPIEATKEPVIDKPNKKINKQIKKKGKSTKSLKGSSCTS